MTEISKNHNFKDKVIVISGSGGVLCAFLAKELAKTQAKIALLDINLDAANKVADEITQQGGIAKAYKTNVLDLESLFAGKLHAILCRNYKNNIKGRDYYDFIFYINKGVKPNLTYLRNKLIESNKLNENDEFNIEILKNMLRDKFNEIDFNQVKQDAQKFTIQNENLSFYCKELFIDCLNKL